MSGRENCICSLSRSFLIPSPAFSPSMFPRPLLMVTQRGFSNLPSSGLSLRTLGKSRSLLGGLDLLRRIHCAIPEDSCALSRFFVHAALLLAESLIFVIASKNGNSATSKTGFTKDGKSALESSRKAFKYFKRSSTRTGPCSAENP